MAFCSASPRDDHFLFLHQHAWCRPRIDAATSPVHVCAVQPLEMARASVYWFVRFHRARLATISLKRSIAHPLFPLWRAAHSMLFVNNLNQNGSHEQRSRFLPGACDGSLICGMCMSEPDAGKSKRLQDKTRQDKIRQADHPLVGSERLTSIH